MHSHSVDQWTHEHVFLGKQHLRSFKDVRRICRRLDPYLGTLQLREITRDVIWHITQAELKRGNQPATVNR